MQKYRMSRMVRPSTGEWIIYKYVGGFRVWRVIEILESKEKAQKRMDELIQGTLVPANWREMVASDSEYMPAFDDRDYM